MTIGTLKSKLTAPRSIYWRRNQIGSTRLKSAALFSNPVEPKSISSPPNSNQGALFQFIEAEFDFDALEVFPSVPDSKSRRSQSSPKRRNPRRALRFQSSALEETAGGLKSNPVSRERS